MIIHAALLDEVLCAIGSDVSGKGIQSARKIAKFYVIYILFYFPNHEIDFKIRNLLEIKEKNLQNLFQRHHLQFTVGIRLFYESVRRDQNTFTILSNFTPMLKIDEEYSFPYVENYCCR